MSASEKAWLDRAGDRRVNAEDLALRWRAGARLLVVEDGVKLPAQFGIDVTSLGDEECALRADDLFLGEVTHGTTSTPWFARQGMVTDEMSLRDGVLDPVSEELAATAIALFTWHLTEPRCERCNGLTHIAVGGFSRVCEDCSREIFPRTDPAMIVVLLDEDDRLLLGHQGTWPKGRISLLAGFVEAGESAEQCVAREVREESGLRVEKVRYIASQPWPFPRSLMLGFMALANGEPVVDGVEIGWARWFSRTELDDAIAAGEVELSGNGSIARRMIERWRAGDISVSHFEG